MIRRTKLFFVLALLLVPTLLLAEEISLNSARRTAETFLSKREGGTRANARLTCINVDATTRSGEPMDYYIFNREGGGFVIVSALDAAIPVLGYSLDKSFSLDEDMPESLADMLALYRYQIRARRASGASATAEERARWEDEGSLTRTERPVTVDLKTAEYTIRDIIKFADKALFHAKDRGKDDVFVYRAPAHSEYEYRRVSADDFE